MSITGVECLEPSRRAKGRCYFLDLVTVFRVCFVVGIVAIPILYLLLGRKALRRNDDRMRNNRDDELAMQRERQSEEYEGSSAEATE